MTRRTKVCLVRALAVAGFFGAGAVAKAAPLLAIDFNDRTEGEAGQEINTAPGFSAFTLGGSGSQTTASGTVNGYALSITVFDANGDTGGVGAMDDRDRAVPTTAPNLNQLYDDLIFVGNSAGDVGGGMDLTISGGALTPNTQYLVSIYAYDGAGSTNTPVRSALWTDGNNADAPVLTTSFTVNVPPVTDEQYKFTGIAVTDSAGNLLLKGRDTTAGDIALYVNGLEINPIPEPGCVAGVALATVFFGRRARKESIRAILDTPPAPSAAAR